MNYLLVTKVFTLWLIYFMQINTAVHAQGPSFVQLNGESEFWIKEGEEQEISLSFLIKEGFHIQAAKVEDENLIPSVLSIDGSDDLIIGDPVFPQAVGFKMQGVEEDIYVYSDILEIKVPVKAVKSAEKSAFLIKGKLHYQACDAYKCYFPRDLNFTMKINIQ